MARQVTLDPNAPKWRYSSSGGVVPDLPEGAFWSQQGRIFNKGGVCIGYESGPPGDRAKELDGVQRPAPQTVTPAPADAPTPPAPPATAVDTVGLEAELKGQHATKLAAMVSEYGEAPATGQGSKAKNIARLVELAKA